MLPGGGKVEHDGAAEAKHRLPEVLPARGQARRVAADEFAVVVDESHGAEKQGHAEHDPDVVVAPVRPQQGADGDAEQDQQATHGRCAGLFKMGLRAVFAHDLAHLGEVEALDNRRAENQRHHQRGDHAEGGAHGDVLQHREAAVDPHQVLGQPVHHQPSPPSRSLAAISSMRAPREPLTSTTPSWANAPPSSASASRSRLAKCLPSGPKPAIMC